MLFDNLEKRFDTHGADCLLIVCVAVVLVRQQFARRGTGGRVEGRRGSDVRVADASRNHPPLSALYRLAWSSACIGHSFYAATWSAKTFFMNTSRGNGVLEQPRDYQTDGMRRVACEASEAFGPILKEAAAHGSVVRGGANLHPGPECMLLTNSILLSFPHLDRHQLLIVGFSISPCSDQSVDRPPGN